jgi:hypothetical protein
MSNNIVDIGSKRKLPPTEIYMCNCGSGLFRLFASGQVECVNCADVIESLHISADEDIEIAD